MALLLAAAFLVVLLPVIARTAWLLLRAYLALAVLFLPAGLLLRLVASLDLRVYFGVTAAWGVVLLFGFAAWRRRRGAPAPDAEAE